MSRVFNSTNSTLGNNVSIFYDSSFIPKALSTNTIVVFMVLYILIIVLAVFSNLTVIVVIGKTRSVRSVTDVLILSLAVSDLMVACLNMPFQLYYIVSNEWDIGDTMCKFVNYIQGVTVVSSIFTLTAIAFERYIVICQTSHARWFHTKRVAGILLAGVWVLTLGSMAYTIWRLQLVLRLKVDYEAHNIIGVGYLCVEKYPSHYDRYVENICFYVIFYLLPVTIMFVAYGAIAHRLWIRQPIGDILENPRHHESHMKRKKGVIKMLTILVFVFTVLWFPFFTSTLYLEMHEKVRFRAVRAIFQLIGYLNCLVNPIIYSILKTNFQRDFVKTFSCRKVRMDLQSSHRTPATRSQTGLVVSHM